MYPGRWVYRRRDVPGLFITEVMYPGCSSRRLCTRAVHQEEEYTRAVHQEEEYTRAVHHGEV